MIRGKGFVCSCPDDIKDHLPEFPFAISKGSKTAGTIVQRESVILAARIADLAVKERKNLLIDGTGALLNRYKNVIRRLKRAGYRVEVVGVHAPMSIVKERIAKRAKATGRYVPAKVLEWYAGKVPCNFVPVSKVADSFALYDVSGKKPRAILVKKNNRRTADPVELARITKKCRL
jgi:predicted ABC-type ATPase